MKNSEKIDLIFNDLGEWLECSECDDSISYAYRNGYKLHAVSLWLNTGATSESILEKTKGVKISRSKELKEINDICNEAFIYICKDCNHHAFLDDDEGESIQCSSCLKTATRKHDNGNKK